MNTLQIETLEKWFDGYVQGFQDMEPEDLKNIDMKIEHTKKVRQVMEQLCAGERLSSEDSIIAGAVALLHDVGRFPQYRRWRTFRDGDSDNHARLAIELIREHKLLDKIPSRERILIEEAVRFHNQLQLPKKLKSGTTLFARLIRDADKLDIWRVFMDYFRMPAEERASAVSLGFPDLPEITPECVATLASGTVIRLDSLKTLNDFRLLLISWVYDLNFTSSYRLLTERSYIAALATALPDTADIRSAIAKATHAVMVKAA